MTDKAKAAQDEQIITLTPGAIDEAKRLMSEETSDRNAFLRIGVKPGGCSGISYVMNFETERSGFDREFDFDGLRVRVDLKALMYLAGTTLDYKGGLMGAGFSFDNPKAKRSCGCGSSFSA